MGELVPALKRSVTGPTLEVYLGDCSSGTPEAEWKTLLLAGVAAEATDAAEAASTDVQLVGGRGGHSVFLQVLERSASAWERTCPPPSLPPPP